MTDLAYLTPEMLTVTLFLTLAAVAVPRDLWWSVPKCPSWSRPGHSESGTSDRLMQRPLVLDASVPPGLDRAGLGRNENHHIPGTQYHEVSVYWELVPGVDST